MDVSKLLANALQPSADLSSLHIANALSGRFPQPKGDRIVSHLASVAETYCAPARTVTVGGPHGSVAAADGRQLEQSISLRSCFGWGWPRWHTLRTATYE